MSTYAHQHLPIVDGTRLIGMVGLVEVCRLCPVFGEYTVAAVTS